jgi:lipopolysaccharide export system protein LptC
MTYVDRYSRTVAWLKVSLPLLALVILSTLFLISRVVEPTATIPFADAEVQMRLARQQVTGPYFSGVSSDGDQIEIYAEVFSAAGGREGENSIQDVRLSVRFADGLQARLVADKAIVNIAEDISRLDGHVRFETSDGYALSGDHFDVRMSSPEISASETIVGKTPAGSVTAGSMHIAKPRNNGSIRLVFTNGVKVLYNPKIGKE